LFGEDLLWKSVYEFIQTINILFIETVAHKVADRELDIEWQFRRDVFDFMQFTDQDLRIRIMIGENENKIG
jgi:hypothetical protein